MCAGSVHVPPSVSFAHPFPVSLSDRGSHSDFAHFQSDLPSHRNEVDFNALHSQVSMACEEAETEMVRGQRAEGKGRSS